MATIFHTQDPAAVEALHDYLALARKRFTQAQIADYLKVDSRTVQRWSARQSEPPVYLVAALRQMLFPMAPDTRDAEFTFIDLFAGIGGIRLGFEASGGKCVFTSEWDANAQKTYAANFPDGHSIHGDITQVDARSVPDHDVLLAGFPCQPFSIAGVSKKNSLGLDHDCPRQRGHDGPRVGALRGSARQGLVPYRLHLVRGHGRVGARCHVTPTRSVAQRRTELGTRAHTSARSLRDDASRNPAFVSNRPMSTPAPLVRQPAIARSSLG